MSPTSYQTAPPRGGPLVIAKPGWFAGCASAFVGQVRGTAPVASRSRTTLDTLLAPTRLVASRFQSDPPCVTPIDVKRQAERRFLALLEDSGLPAPDEVQYAEHCVRFLWLDRKVVVVVDLDDFGDADANGGYTREGITS
jgi:hypothetical protein